MQRGANIQSDIGKHTLADKGKQRDGVSVQPGPLFVWPTEINEQATSERASFIDVLLYCI